MAFCDFLDSVIKQGSPKSQEGKQQSARELTLRSTELSNIKQALIAYHKQEASSNTDEKLLATLSQQRTNYIAQLEPILLASNTEGSDLKAKLQAVNIKLGKSLTNEIFFPPLNLQSAIGESDLSGFNLSKSKMHNSSSEGAWLISTNLHETQLPNKLEGVVFIDCDLSSRDLSKHDLYYTRFSRVNLSETVFPQYLRKVSFEDLNLSNVDLSKNEICGVTFDTVNLTNTILPERLTNVTFRNCDLSNKDFSTYDLDSVEFVNVNLTGTKLPTLDVEQFEREHATKNSFRNCDLSNLDLSKQNLTGLTFKNVNLENTTLPAELKNITFVECNLKNQDLSKHQLDGVTFKNTDLRETVLTEDLGSITFENSTLKDEDLYRLTCLSLFSNNLLAKILRLAIDQNPNHHDQALEMARTYNFNEELPHITENLINDFLSNDTKKKLAATDLLCLIRLNASHPRGGFTIPIQKVIREKIENPSGSDKDALIKLRTFTDNLFSGKNRELIHRKALGLKFCFENPDMHQLLNIFSDRSYNQHLSPFLLKANQIQRSYDFLGHKSNQKLAISANTTEYPHTQPSIADYIRATGVTRNSQPLTYVSWPF